VGSNFRDLAAYRLASELAAELHSATRAWPGFDRYVIGGQMLRAAYSRRGGTNAERTDQEGPELTL
jgi:hypothetical protein